MADQEASVNVKVPLDLWEWIKIAAREDDRTGASMVRKILKDYLDRKDNTNE